MKEHYFLTQLRSQGVQIKHGTKHYKLYYNGRQATLRRHPSKELYECLCIKIKKQLGLN